MKKQIETKEAIWIGVRIFLILGFVVLSFFQMGFHERWADEAQAWLLARDASFFDLIFKYASLEGSTMLWHIILKVCISLGLNYSWYGIIPIIATVIGLVILEFKLKVPWYIKLLLPFTYYIFYQYTVIARSYCLVFPILCYLAMIYPKRLEKPFFYGIGLVLLAGISLHGCLISGALFLLFAIDYITKRLKEEKSIKSIFREKNILITLLLITIIYCFIIITVYPKEGIPQFASNYTMGKIEKTFQIIGEAIISSNEERLIVNIFSTLLGVSITALLLIQAKKEKRIVFILIPLGIFLVLIYGNYWHIGVFAEAIFFVWYILFQNQKENKSKFEKALLVCMITIVMFIQITWSISSFQYDKNNSYSQGENVAIYLKEADKSGKTIWGLNYSVITILPYFETNIFDNFPNKKESFYSWSENSGRVEDKESVINTNADIYVIPKVYELKRLREIEELKKLGYQCRNFDSCTYIKNDVYEYSGYLVFEK